jgi:hypothetical protein
MTGMGGQYDGDGRRSEREYDGHGRRSVRFYDGHGRRSVRYYDGHGRRSVRFYDGHGRRSVRFYDGHGRRSVSFYDGHGRRSVRFYDGHGRRSVRFHDGGGGARELRGAFKQQQQEQQPGISQTKGQHLTHAPPLLRYTRCVVLAQPSVRGGARPVSTGTRNRAVQRMTIRSILHSAEGHATGLGLPGRSEGNGGLATRVGWFRGKPDHKQRARGAEKGGGGGGAVIGHLRVCGGQMSWRAHGKQLRQTIAAENSHPLPPREGWAAGMQGTAVVCRGLRLSTYSRAPT